MVKNKIREQMWKKKNKKWERCARQYCFRLIPIFKCFLFPVVNLTFVGFVRLLSISWLVVKKKLNYQLLILCVNATFFIISLRFDLLIQPV